VASIATQKKDKHGDIMTIKVNRHKVAEEYNTTSDWLKTHLSTRYSSTEKFATIEEKMEDMKKRVEFDKVRSISKSAECNCGECDACLGKGKCNCGECDMCLSKKKEDCGCNSCDACSIDSPKKSGEVSKLKEYIMGVIGDPGVENSVSNIIGKCEQNKSISLILNKVKNQALLVEYIQHMIEKLKKEDVIDEDASVYMTLEEAHSMGDIEENDPQYVHYGDHS
jgi:hypothetical protein